MPRLEAGTNVAMCDGSTVTVEAFIASGGQGEVYRVRSGADGRRLALKWYTDPSIAGNDAFLANLKYNCAHAAPSPSFIWPEGVACRASGSYGYTMRLRPPGYMVLGDFFCIDRNPEAYFRSELAKITAALRICDSFSRLHSAGLSYQDLNDGNFLIEPHTGDVLICDSDNIAADGHNNGISGKPRYMAPEVAEGGIPTAASDRLSLAIILYRIFMADHPFEGALTCSPRHACLTPAEQTRLFGRDAVFCFDPDDRSNRPLELLQPNSLFFWDMVPEALRRMFCKALSRTAIRQPDRRTGADEWKELMLALRAALICCHNDPSDPPHDYMAEPGIPPGRCPRCGADAPPHALLLYDNGLSYTLSDGKPLYEGDSFAETAVCRADGHTLTLEYPDGRRRPLRDGSTLCSGNNKATIKLIHPDGSR